MDSRNRASELLDYLVEQGAEEGDILYYILNNFFSGSEALEALRAVQKDFLEDEEDEDADDRE